MCPKEATTNECVELVHSLIMCDRRSPRDIARQTDIHFGVVQSNLTNILGMSKVSAKYVPRMLTKDQEKCKLDISKFLPSLYEDDPEEFMRRLVTQDETWVHRFEPEAKKQSMQWKHHGSPSPKKKKEFLQARAVMVCMFWALS